MDKKILFLYTGGHPAHLKFGRTVTNHIAEYSQKLPKNFDVYLSEGKYPKLTLMRMMSRINKNAKIIVLFADPRLFYLNTSKYFDSKKNKVLKYPLAKKIISKRFLKKLDGALCVGEFEGKLFKRLNKTIPLRIVYPFPDKKLFEKLIRIKPSLNKPKIIFVGNGPDYYYKGIDILIKVFEEIKKNLQNAELHILGAWNAKKEWAKSGVYFDGVQKNIAPYLKDSSLCIHLGRGDTFPVSTLEAMIAGIPTIVSKYTGVKQIVKKIDEKFIVDFDAKSIADTAIQYLKSDPKKKQALSKKFKKEASKYNEEKLLKHFKKEFLSLTNEIYNQNAKQFQKDSNIKA